MTSPKSSHGQRRKSAGHAARSAVARTASFRALQERLQAPDEDGACASSCEIAEYIAKMSAELAKLAGTAGLSTLVYLLNLARLEAKSHAAGLSPPS